VQNKTQLQLMMESVSFQTKLNSFKRKKEKKRINKEK